MVIYPSAAEWKEQPDIEQGANVREDQVLLMIPDLTKMQVKVGIHESKIDRVEVGMPASVNLTEGSVAGRVASISNITKPSGWWNGNMVNYETLIELDEQEGLKPGMSVSVEVFMAKHKGVLTVPVVAVVELGKRNYCWVAKDGSVEKREIKVLDTNDQHVVVSEGLSEGDEVVMNPLDFVDEAQATALEPLDDRTEPESVPDVEPAKADKKSNAEKGKDGKKGWEKESRREAGAKEAYG